MKRVMAILLFALSSAVLAGAAETPAATGQEMPAALYQKLKGYFDALYGPQVALLPGLQTTNRAEVENSLRKDAATNKAILLKALESPKALQREMAARSLEYCGDKAAAIEALKLSVVSDSDENVRRAAAVALAKLPDASSVEALMKALADSADPVRGVSATALGNIKDSRATEALLRLVNTDSMPMVRLQAATALSKIKDPKSLEALKKALESEKDERVKMAIAGAVRSLKGGNSAETESIPTAEDAAKELTELSTEMKSVEDKLRNDRHDQAVQAQGNQIEKKLSALIEKVDKACNSGGSCNKPGEQQASQPKSGNKQNNGKSGGNPLADSKPGANVPEGATSAAQVSGTQDPWAKLPPAQRDELLQAYREEVPERWRKRLEAYFLSIAVEEAKDQDK